MKRLGPSWFPIYRSLFMRTCLLCLSLCALLSGCVTRTYDSEGNPIGKDNLETDIVVDDYGRIVAKPTHIYPPDRIVVNGDTPTEREIRLLVVEGAPRHEAPNTFAKSQEWMRKFVAPADEIFIKPSLDAELSDEIIYGIVYLPALDSKTGRPIPGGYVNVNMAMLSQGLVRIRDLREVDDEGLKKRMKEAESIAKRNKDGLWSSDP